MVLELKKGKTAFTTLILATLTIALILTLTLKIHVTALEETKIMVLPAENTFYANETLPGDTFTLDITVVNVTDLQNWQIKFIWDSSLLDYVDIWLPDDHVFSGSGYAMITAPKLPEPGGITWGCTYVNSPYWTFNGTGTLCQIELKILTPPSPPPVTCDLALVGYQIDTFLLDGVMHDIAFTMEDATFAYEDPMEASISPSAALVHYGENATFTVTASNGAEPYRYQWYFKYPNGTEIEITGAENETSWTTPPITETGTHRVTVNVTDSLGYQVKVSATVAIWSLSVTISPQYPVVDVDGTKMFTATISGGIQPYTIKWYRNDTEVPAVENETVVSFTFSEVGIEYVKVSVTDSELSQDYVTATVKILPPPTTTVKVVPETATFYTNMTKVGDKIIFNVTVQDVEELYNWQIKLMWDPTLLNYSNIYLPDDHVFAASGKPISTPPPTVGFGNVSWGCTLIVVPGEWTFNGTGTLCQVELEIIRHPSPLQSSCTVDLIERYGPMGTTLIKPVEETIPISIGNATYTYVLVKHVTHALLGYTIETYSNASILANSVLQSDTSINFTVSGEPGTAGFVNVTIPKALLRLADTSSDNWIVYLNGVDVTTGAIITEDDDYTYVYLEFTFSSGQTIEIVGTWIVPEFMSPYALIILMITLLIAVIFAKTSTRKKWIK